MKKIFIITAILIFIAMPCFAGFFSNDDGDCPPSPPDPDPPPSPCDMAPIVPAPFFK